LPAFRRRRRNESQGGFNPVAELTFDARRLEQIEATIQLSQSLAPRTKEKCVQLAHAQTGVTAQNAVTKPMREPRAFFFLPSKENKNPPTGIRI
jgi:hypothetical protein